MKAMEEVIRRADLDRTAIRIRSKTGHRAGLFWRYRKERRARDIPAVVLRDKNELYRYSETEVAKCLRDEWCELYTEFEKGTDVTRPLPRSLRDKLMVKIWQLSKVSC